MLGLSFHLHIVDQQASPIFGLLSFSNFAKQSKLVHVIQCFGKVCSSHYWQSSLLQPEFPEMLGRLLNLNEMKTKIISNHMSQYFIHNRT